MVKDRSGNRPRRAGRGPKSNPPRRGAGQNRPNKGASTGNTGRGSTHKPGGMCRLGQAVAALILVYIALAVAGMVVA